MESNYGYAWEVKIDPRCPCHGEHRFLVLGFHRDDAMSVAFAHLLGAGLSAWEAQERLGGAIYDKTAVERDEVIEMRVGRIAEPSTCDVCGAPMLDNTTYEQEERHFQCSRCSNSVSIPWPTVNGSRAPCVYEPEGRIK